MSVYAIFKSLNILYVLDLIYIKKKNWCEHHPTFSYYTSFYQFYFIAYNERKRFGESPRSIRNDEFDNSLVEEEGEGDVMEGSTADGTGRILNHGHQSD